MPDEKEVKALPQPLPPLPDLLPTPPVPAPEAVPEESLTTKRHTRSILNAFPPNVLVAIDVMISYGYGAVRISKELSTTYVKDIPSVPSVKTVHTYIIQRRKLLDQDQDLRLQVEHSGRQISMMDVNTKDPLAVIEALYELHCERIEAVKLLNRRLGSPQFEKVLVDLMSSMNKLLETQMNLEQHGKLMDLRMAAVVQVLAKHIISGTTQVFKNMSGEERLLEFSEGLDAMVRGLDFPAIELEIVEAMTTNKKGQANV